MERRSSVAVRGLVAAAALLLLVLGVLFANSFKAEMVLFANDGPLGAAVARYIDVPEGFTGVWADLNWLGANGASIPPAITHLIRFAIGDLNYAKFYSPITLLILGLSAWAYFRQAGFRQMVCLLAGLAAALNSNIFSNVCWGLGTRALCVAGVFGALAFIESSRKGRAYLKLPLAGMCLGIAIMEGSDNGAILSLYVAVFTIVLWLAGNGAATATEKTPRKLFKGMAAVAVVA